jgi:low temperature requirement protein LtrA
LQWVIFLLLNFRFEVFFGILGKKENIMLPLLFRPLELRDEKGSRHATWLELFFDLAFVISIAALTTMLVKNTTLGGLALYIGLFFAVFWAWNQLTWYSALFDNDDAFFRIIYLGAILSVLILAASIPSIAQGETTLFVVSYVLLQVFLAAGWVRVYVYKREFRSFSLKYLIGPVVGSVVWLVSTRFPIPQQYYFWVVAMVIHIVAPYIAWRTITFHIPVHTSHIVERYCLFTIIVLGETLVAVSVGMGSAQGSAAFLTALFVYVIIACIWWSYFNWDFNKVRKLETVSKVFIFGYGHFFIFLSIAAFGAGGEIAIHSVAHGSHSTLLERMLIALSPSLYLFSLSIMNRFSWNMAFGRKMKARISIAILSLVFALVASHISLVVFTGVLALLMVCLVSYEHIRCITTGD